MMMRGVVASLAAAAFGLALANPPAAQAAPSGLNFDQGVSASDILKQAKEQAKQDKTAIAPAYIGSTRYERDCRAVTFNPADRPESGQIHLRSTEWITECNNYGGGGYYPGPGGHPIPVPPGQNCWERPGYSYSGEAQVTLRDRQQLYPWEYDKFEVCLEGPWYSLYTITAAYEYKMVQGGNRDGNFVLSPIKKTAMKPDPAGIVAQGFSSSMVLTLKDKWASYYAGEQTVLKLVLKKDLPNWFDTVIVEKELALAPAEAYRVNMLDFAKEFSQKLEPGKNYYVEYSFKRVGKISKPDLMKVGETDKAAYQPATLAAAY
ncbi:MAG: hypothetical protein HY926_11965 [Elusimicrobia bacterium]|nr:hypothetical protein [Elusimicrobiota bacterium]